METYMNYASMPDFVKVMRALPLVGSPFLSFAYAMGLKTAKTAINNPAIFNKVGFLMNEITGERSPAEKTALAQQYNSYLNSPAVVRIFGMWNVSFNNLIPWFSQNLIDPSQRSYDPTSTQAQMMNIINDSPIMNDPIGGVIRDYFIQPWVLSGSGQVPQGTFGQPLYPTYDANGKLINASLGTKLLYAGRTLAESLVPGSVGYAGLANIPGEMSPGAVNLIPSYGFRTIANAVQGRSSVGAMTKEDAVRKGLRAVLGRSGIPVYTLNTTNVTPPK
jgi:hypothetical protein